MSVEAINAAEPQQRQGNPIGSAIAGGLGLGAVGGTAGYFIGNKRPSLEEVFTQKPDTFKSEAVTKIDNDAATKLQQAVDEYEGAIKTPKENFHTKLKERAALVNDEAKVAPDNLTDLKTKLTEEEGKLKKVKVGEAGKEVELTYKEAQVEVEKAAKDYFDAKEKLAKSKAKDKTALQNAVNDAKNALDTAKKNRKAVYDGAKAEADNYIKAQREIMKAKEAKYNALRAEAGEAKTLSEALADLKTKYANAKKTKLEEILGRDEIKQAFDKIKSGIAKEGGKKWAMIAGGIAAAIGLIGGYVMGNKQA